jgi:hypothetical protein
LGWWTQTPLHFSLYLEHITLPYFLSLYYTEYYTILQCILLISTLELK